MKRAHSILFGVFAVVAVGLFSCSTNSVNPRVSEEPNLSGVWVDTTGGYVSTLILDSGAFTLRVPDLNLGFDEPDISNALFDTPERMYKGSYLTRIDSLHLNYSFFFKPLAYPGAPGDSSEMAHEESFRFQFFGDSLSLFFKRLFELDTTASNRDTTGRAGAGIGQVYNVGLPSALWPYGYEKMSGVFKKVEE